MSEFTKKTSENLTKIKQLEEVIYNVEFKVADEILKVDLIKKKLKTRKGKTKTIITVNHEEFPETHNVIRLYLPLMGDAGYVPNEDEIVKLFQGKSIVPPKGAFLSKNSKPYSLEKFVFKPLSENTYKGKVKYYGEGVAYFPENNN